MFVHTEIVNKKILILILVMLSKCKPGLTRVLILVFSCYARGKTRSEPISTDVWAPTHLNWRSHTVGIKLFKVIIPAWCQWWRHCMRSLCRADCWKPCGWTRAKTWSEFTAKLRDWIFPLGEKTCIVRRCSAYKYSLVFGCFLLVFFAGVFPLVSSIKV